jgi:hypothetical protein
MTTSDFHPPVPYRPDPFRLDLPGRRTLGTALWACAVMVPMSFLMLGIDTRVLDDEAVWMKPIKFQISLGLHAGTLLLLFASLPGEVAGARLTRWVGTTVGATILYEIAFVTLQAARGVRSHFNHDTAFDDIGGKIMAAGAGILTLAPALIGVAVMWHLFGRRDDQRRSPGRRLPLYLSIGLGLILSGWLGGQTGGAIGANQGPLVGAAVGPFVPLTGWSLSGGDLRIAHFFGLHAMQALPILGLVFGRFLPQRRATLSVVVSAMVWTALVLWCLAAAQSGRPPI